MNGQRELDLKLLSVNQVAELLGVKVSTLYAWRLRRKNLPFVRCGRSLRIPAGAVQDFVRRNTIPPSEDRDGQ
jgi:excisionase family DNA binding protein